jgi:Raf kinase inhibitor-like YbhB/YbcL family protein
MSVVLRVALVLAVVLLAACGGDQRLEDALPRGRGGLTVSSPDFRAGGPMPRRFSCAGAGDRPVLRWSGVPRRARELVLIVVDPDAAGFVHWTVYGMRPSARGLRATGLPPGAKEGKSSAGDLGWTPACPPQGDAPHRYQFTLYWLRRRTGLTEGVEPGEVVAALKGVVGGRGQLVGRFERS